MFSPWFSLGAFCSAVTCAYPPPAPRLPALCPGQEKPFTIEGCWLIRGTSIQPLLDCNPDAEYYTWSRADVENAGQREKVGKYWCESNSIDGRVVYDSKVFK